jgi:hypothetical protein
VGRVYSGDARTAVESLTLPVFQYPSDPAANNATETEKRKWQKRVGSTVVKEDQFKEDMKKVYLLIWGQCTESLWAKLEAASGYTRMKTDYDSIELLKSIKDCIFKFSSQKFGHQSRHKALRKFYTPYQDKNSNSNEYYRRFKNQIDVIEHCGARVGEHPEGIEETLAEMSNWQWQKKYQGKGTWHVPSYWGQIANAMVSSSRTPKTLTYKKTTNGRRHWSRPIT